MVFRDQVVRCGACGAEFVYTVREQRRRAEQGLPVDAPVFCADCRGADVRLAEAAPAIPVAAPRASRTGSPARPARVDRSRDRQGTRSRPSERGGRSERPGSGHGGGRGRSGGGRPRSRQTEVRFRYVGTVRWYDDAKGYGFITQDEDTDEVFVHSSAIIAAGVQRLREGQPVEYEVEQTPRGLQAVDVVPLAV